MPEDYIKALLGEHAVHAAFNYVVQGDKSENRAALIGNTCFAEQMSFGGIKMAPHTLVLCDVFIRPHLVIASKHLVGVGAAGILTSDALAHTDQWLRHGQIILDNLPRH